MADSHILCSSSFILPCFNWPRSIKRDTRSSQKLDRNPFGIFKKTKYHFLCSSQKIYNLPTTFFIFYF